MNTPLPSLSSFTPEQIEAWLDGELPADEAAILDRLALDDLSLQQRRRAHEALRCVLSREIPVEPELPYADFFMHQLERRIEAEQLREEEAKQSASTATQASVTGSKSSRSWMNWLPWGLSAACAAALALVVSLPNASSPQGGQELVEASSEAPALLSAYSPRAEIRTVASNDAPVVVVLEGLPEYEGEVRGVGLRLSETEANHPRKNKWSVADNALY